MESIKKHALENDVPIIMDEGLTFICDYIKENDVEKVLEIGSAVGYSALSFSNSNDCFVTTIERDENMYKQAVKNIKNANKENKIRIFYADALEFNTDNLTREFDVLFIDAAKAQYEKFFTIYTPFLKDNGVVICDNLNFHGWVNKTEFSSRNLRQLVGKIRRFRDFLTNNELFETVFYEVGDGISISKRKN